MMNIIYLRKSREDLNKDDTLENHRKTLTELCYKNGWEFRIFEEVASSNSIDSRIEIQKVLELIKQGKVQRLICMALDRLSRNSYDGAYIQKLLEENNVIVVTPQKTYDYTNESDLMLGDFERLIAAQEYRIIKKRMLAGREASFKNGGFPAGEPPFGYYRDYNENKCIKIDPEKAEIYRWIVDSYLTGKYTTHQLAYEFNARGYKGNRGASANQNRIWKMLCNRFYLGEVKYKGEWGKGNHEALISLDEYNKIQEILQGNSVRPRKGYYREIKKLSQLCKCGVCGHTLTVVKNSNMGCNYTRCWYIDDYGNRCSNFGARENVILDVLFEEIERHIELMQFVLSRGSDELLKKQQEDLLSQIKDLDLKLKKLEERERNTIELAKSGILSVADTKKEIDSINFVKNGLQIEKSDIKYNYDSLNGQNIEQKLNNFKEMYEKLKQTSSDEEFNQIIRHLVNRITITKPDRKNLHVDIKFL